MARTVSALPWFSSSESTSSGKVYSTVVVGGANMLVENGGRFTADQFDFVGNGSNDVYILNDAINSLGTSVDTNVEAILIGSFFISGSTLNINKRNVSIKGIPGLTRITSDWNNSSPAISISNSGGYDNVTFDGIDFEKVNAGDGQLIYAQYSGGKISIVNCNFTVNGSSSRMIDLANSNGSYINNCNFTYNIQTAGAAIRLTSCRNAKIENCSYTTPASSNGFLAQVITSNNVVITSCYTDGGEEAVRISQSNNVNISHNNFNNFGTHGIRCPSDSIPCRYINITNNNFGMNHATTTSTFGLTLQTVLNSSVINNSFYADTKGSKQGVSTGNFSKTIVSGNRFYNLARALNLIMPSATDNIVTNNYCESCSMGVIVTSTQYSYVVTGNIVVDATTAIDLGGLTDTGSVKGPNIANGTVVTS